MRCRAILAAFLACSSGALAEEGVLRVGMDTRTPPWSFVPGLDYSQEDATRDPQVSEAQLKKAEGFDPDVARALARRLGLALRVVPVSWFDMEKGLLAGRYDAIVGSWTPGPKTPAGILASVPYGEWGLLVAVRADNKRIASYADLAGTIVGHYRDTVAERTVRSLNPAKAVPYDAQEALFDDLKAGKIQAALFDSFYVRWRVANDASYRAVGEPLNKLGYHVGVRKEDAALFEKIQAALKAMAAAGELAGIQKKWEGGK